MSPTLRQERKTRTAAEIAAAALELFTSRGFAPVTMAEIATAAGVSQRTLYRYVTDKEELLFGDDEAFRGTLRSAVVRRPPDEHPFTALRAASMSAAGVLEGRRADVERRAAIIAATPALLGRERAKHAAWEAVLADAVLERGVPTTRARLLGRITVACYDEAITRWLEDTGQAPNLTTALKQAFDDVESLSALGGGSSESPVRC